MEAALGVVVEDVRWRPHDLDVDLCGHDAVRAYCTGLEAPGNRLELFPYVFEPIGSAVLVAGVLRVLVPDGWRDLPRWWVHEIDEGHVGALRGYDSRERALAAAERPP